MGQPFTILSILVFVAVAVLHVLRLAFGWPMTIVGAGVPEWVSAVIIVTALILALGLWLEMRRARRILAAERQRERHAGTTRGATREAPAQPRPDVVWHDPTTGMRLPANYFMFASAGVSAKKIREAADKYGRIMVGFDSGNAPQASLNAARDVGAELEVYVEGPGGPTGNAWLPDEAARIKVAAASVGVDTSKSQQSWMKEWNDWGWKEYTFKQLENYLHKGYSAGEIDNLYRALDDEPDAYVSFYGEYAQRQVAGRLPRLVLKNQSEAQLEALVDAVQKGDIPRSMFAEFHISEKGTGDRKKQNELTSRIGIRTVPSNDTYNYDAYGEFGLETQYASLLTPKPTIQVAAAPSVAQTAPTQQIAVAQTPPPAATPPGSAQQVAVAQAPPPPPAAAPQAPAQAAAANPVAPQQPAPPAAATTAPVPAPAPATPPPAPQPTVVASAQGVPIDGSETTIRGRKA